MKISMFHLMPHRELPADFESKYHSVWVDPPFWELADPVVRATRRQSVIAALRDLNLRTDLGNGHDFALSWSRNWFAGIGHNEMYPARLERLSRFWSYEYSAVQKVLKAAVRTSRIR